MWACGLAVASGLFLATELGAPGIATRSKDATRGSWLVTRTLLGAHGPKPLNRQCQCVEGRKSRNLFIGFPLPSPTK